MLRCFVVALSLFVWVAAAPAQQTPKEIEARFEEQLKRFDPKAVAAARSYSRTFNMGAQMQQSVQAMLPGFRQQTMAKNPGLTAADFDLFFSEFMKVALVDSAPLIEKFTMISMLEILSTEEIVAVDQFYSSEIGKSVMNKLPKMMGKMPELMGLMERHMIPAGLAAAQAKLRALGKDVKI